MKVLILGVNGFIGSHLSTRILETTDWDVYGMDLGEHKLGTCLGNKRFHFRKGNIAVDKKWIDSHIRKCDVVLPLVAIATPKTYVENPLSVFKLDFEENLRIIRQCVKYEKRVIFPSTSEVYGMCPDAAFDEYKSNLVLGPIEKERWIYSCSKQLLDRVIWAYGKQGLDFTLFRPFNWIGARLDSLETAKKGESRVVTQFIAALVSNEPISLVDGGTQSRSFTYIDDGIDALMKIIENRNGKARGQIFNIGNPANNCSIKDLADKLIELFKQHPSYDARKYKPRVVVKKSQAFYGDNYQDVNARVPSIANAGKILGWKPTVPLEKALELTLDSFLGEAGL